MSITRREPRQKDDDDDEMFWHYTTRDGAEQILEGRRINQAGVAAFGPGRQST
jgi:hypothetical protein